MGGAGSGRTKKKGRPTKLTRELHDEIVRLIEAGNYAETAAAVGGIQPHTLRDWIRRGARETTGPYAAFSSAVKKAEGRAEASAVLRIRKAGQMNWTAEAWYLERKFPARWGRLERPQSAEPTEGDNAKQLIKRKDVRDLLDRLSCCIGVAGDPSEPSSGSE